MKPPPFDYLPVVTVDEAVAALAEHGGDAKLLAGGQSLMPMLNFRLLSPSVLVDINRIPALDEIRELEGNLRIGALARHRMLETSRPIATHFPIIAHAMGHVAHVAIRNFGTIGGSISHADPAAELPLLAMLLDAHVAAQGLNGVRQIRAADFFTAPLETTLTDDEMVTCVHLPFLPPHHRWGFKEVARRAGDFALAAAACVVVLNDGKISQARVALIGADEVPQRSAAAEAVLMDQTPGAALFDAASDAA